MQPSNCNYVKNVRNNLNILKVELGTINYTNRIEQELLQP